MCSGAQNRMRELVDELNEACRIYYSGGEDEPPMTDAQYDKLLSDLVYLEGETGIRLSDSPTMRVGFDEEVEGKIKHYAPMLSLDDTKSIDKLFHFLGEREALLSWKIDGLSIELYYTSGNLIRALTRGDGHVGKDITKNAILMRNVPQQIDVKSNLIVRGEGCLSIKEFEQIKRTKEGEKYGDSPRNLASGLINSTKTTSILLRHMSFIVHSATLIEGYGRDFSTRHEQLEYLKSLGFTIVPYTPVVNYTLKREIDRYTLDVEDYEFPVDGLVLALDDIRYGESLGATAKYPKHSMAFKWPDVTTPTKVIGMKWSVSETGLITPVVLLDPVLLEGTVVKQATLHTLKRFKELGIGIGDTLEVYKANKIIPEVAENFTRSKTEEYPRKCPVCGGATDVLVTSKTEKLYCYRCGGEK